MQYPLANCLRVPTVPRRKCATSRTSTNVFLPALTVLPFDVSVAQVFGDVGALFEEAGQRLADADLQIAATALRHDLMLVTGNIWHFARAAPEPQQGACGGAA